MSPFLYRGAICAMLALLGKYHSSYHSFIMARISFISFVFSSSLYVIASSGRSSLPYALFFCRLRLTFFASAIVHRTGVEFVPVTTFAVRGEYGHYVF